MFVTAGELKVKILSTCSTKEEQLNSEIQTQFGQVSSCSSAFGFKSCLSLFTCDLHQGNQELCLSITPIFFKEVH